MPRWSLAFALVVGGCLSTPDPASSTAIDAAVDAAPVTCRRDALPAGHAWPPPGIDVWSLQIADLDRDGIGDLIVSAGAPTARSDRPAAIYVLYGPVSPSAPQYQVALDLDGDAGPNLQPWATSLDDLDGDGCLDLTIAGPPTAGFTRSGAAVFRHDGSAAAWTGTPVVGAISFEPLPGPTMAAWGDLTTNPARDLVVADLYDIDVLPGSTLTGLGSSINVERPTCNDWNNINGIRMQTRTGLRDRLLVFGHYRNNDVTIDDTGTIVTSNNCDMGQYPITRGIAIVDLDHAPPDDLLTGGGATLGAHLIAGAALPVSPPTGAPLCAGPPAELAGFAAGDLGGTPEPEAVALLNATGPATAYACLISGLTADADMVQSNGTSQLTLGTGVAHVVAIGNLTSVAPDPRAWILDRDGTLHCVRRTTGANSLTPC